MELILWRHAEAAPGTPDEARPLTETGRHHAQAMAQWLRPRLPADLHILCSPALRARQTVAPLALPHDIHQAIAKDRPATDLLKAADWPANRRNIMLVGHQPAFGELIAIILGTSVTWWDMAKGGVWWFSDTQEEEKTEVYVKAVMAPWMLDGQQ
ncbi:MAG TPA: histidine phosphatase family protein [Noviherbaspirillum sp.]